MEVESVIVGGGVTGLCCAHFIGRGGGSSLLFEPSDLGGVARTVATGGFTMEIGPNVLVEKPEMGALLDALNLRPELVRRETPYRQLVWAEGKPVEVPGSPFALLRSPLVGFADKLLLPIRLCTRASLPEDESVSDFVSRFLGIRGCERLVGPVLRGIFGGRAERLSARAAFPELWAQISSGKSVVSYMRSKKGSGRRRIFVLRGGVRTLVNRLKADVSSRTAFASGAVSDISRTEGGFEIRVSDGSVVRSRNVFVTTSGSASAGFIRSLCPGLADRLSALEYSPIVVAHYSVPRADMLPRDTFGLLFPEGATDSRLLGVMFNTSIFPHVAPDGKGLVTVSMGGDGCGEVLSLSDSEIALNGAKELRERLGIRDVTLLSVHRWPRAIPQLRPGHAGIVELMDSAEYDNPGLFFAGVDRGGIGVPDRVRHAALAVERSRAASNRDTGVSLDDTTVVRM